MSLRVSPSAVTGGSLFRNSRVLLLRSAAGASEERLTRRGFFFSAVIFFYDNRNLIVYFSATFSSSWGSLVLLALQIVRKSPQHATISCTSPSFVLP